MLRRLLLCIAAILLLPFVRPGHAASNQVVDAHGDTPSASRDVHYARFETIVHPVDGPTLQITLGLPEWPSLEEPGTYTVAFDYGACGGGQVTFDWLGGGAYSGYDLGLADTTSSATFWSCHEVVNAAGQSVYEYESQEVTVTWVAEGLQWWVPLSHGIDDGVRLTNTKACTGETFLAATEDIRRRGGLDCGTDASPVGQDYVVGSAA